MNKKSVCKTLLFALLLAALLGLCAGASAQVIEECTSINHVGPIVEVNRVSATCTVNGSVQKKCQNCGVIIATEPIIAQGHQLQSRTTTITAPTCTASGMMQVTVKCSVCGYLDSVTNEAIPALGHQLGTPVTVQAATCEGSGISRKTCTRCSYYEDTTIPALGHQWGNPVTTSATCTSAGSIRQTCQRDASHVQIAEIPIDPNAHQWGEGVITKQPTETEDGIRTYTCLRNSAHTMTEAIPALGGNPSGPDDSGFTVENGLITGYTGERTELVIPSEINGVAITGVDEFAFEDNTALTSVSLPSSVVSIGDYAFSGCSGLAQITLPSGLTSIGNCVFKGCSSLNNLGIPSGVTSIGSSAFKDCASLTEINLPNNLTSIGSHAFEGCIGLTEIAVPNTVTSLGSYAFTQCTGLTSATLPTGLTSLANGLFNGCILLKSIDIPAGVTSIGYYAFNGCSGLTSVTIPRGVTSIAYSAFDSCTGLSSIEIPDTVTELGIFAFFNCTSLTSAVIPASVTSIGGQAFGGCNGLTIYGAPGSCAATYANENNIPFAESMTCEHEWGKPTATLSPTKTEKGSAERFCILCGEKDVMEIPALNEMNTLYLPAALTAIEDEAFYLVAADAIIVPDGCTSIGENAFASSSIIYIRVPAGVTIPETAFDGCFGHLVVDDGE